MKKKTISSGNCGGIALALIVFLIGFSLIFMLPIIGWVIGPIMMLAALFMGGKRQAVWKCKQCSHVMDRSAPPSPVMILFGAIIIIGTVIVFFSKPPQKAETQKTEQATPPDIRKQANEEYNLGYIDSKKLKIGHTYELYSAALVTDKINDWGNSEDIPAHYLLVIEQSTDGIKWYFARLLKSDGTEWRTGWVPAERIYDIKNAEK